MHYLLQSIGLRIAQICHALEFDLFLNEERRARLEAELSKLRKDREQFDKTHLELK